MIYEEKLGIPSSGFEYQKLLEEQSILIEYKKTIDFFRQVFSNHIYDYFPELFSEKTNLRFINYGDTQLVYVLSTKNKNWAVLLGQPAIKYGTIKKEFDNLQKLSLINPNVIVKPELYFSNGERELYIAPYLLQARCIANEDNWGVYVPEPFYRFEAFSDETKSIINTCMIANLVRLYIHEESLGISLCKIGGGDFILEKEWSSEPISIYQSLIRMKLIAARELLHISFEEYLCLLRKEFVLQTYQNSSKIQDPLIYINHKSRVSMTEDEIEKGIRLGLKMNNC